MDYVKPAEVVAEALEAAEHKASLPVRDMLVRGALAGVFLGYGTSLTVVARAQGLPSLVGAMLFPMGFVMLVLLGLELATGNFALLPPGMLAGKVQAAGLLRSWGWVYLGNLLGALFYAALFYLAITSMGTSDGDRAASEVRQLAEKKTLAYTAMGPQGWVLALIKGVLANWMVTVGTVLAFVSRSTMGKIVAMWLPISVFFAHGYEHSIVNMFLIPTGMLLGAPISLADWWGWNQAPVTLGNIVGGAVFTGLALHFTYARQGSQRQKSQGIGVDREPAAALPDKGPAQVRERR